MKNKIKPIDVSILSSYMGRSLTVIVTVVVLSLTLSALLSGGGSAERNIISVCVPIEATVEDALRMYEPFRVLLAREAHRPVVLSGRGDEGLQQFDLCIMTTHEYIRLADSADLLPLYQISRSDRVRDKAVLVTKTSDMNVDYAELKPADIAFCDPLSINGFWIQLDALVRRGFDAPKNLDELHFEGLQGDGTRVIFGVLHEAYRVGACKMSELHALSGMGLLRRGELRIVQGDEALPEVVIAARRTDARYYQRKLRRLAELLQDVSSPATQNETVSLLKSFGIKGLHPVRQEQFERYRELSEHLENRYKL